MKVELFLCFSYALLNPKTTSLPCAACAASNRAASPSSQSIFECSNRVLQ